MKLIESIPIRLRAGTVLHCYGAETIEFSEHGKDCYYSYFCTKSRGDLLLQNAAIINCRNLEEEREELRTDNGEKSSRRTVSLEQPRVTA